MARKPVFQRAKLQEALTAYVFLMPALVFIGLWIIYPLFQAFLMSFQELNLLNFSQRTFVGMENYRGLFEDPVFMESLRTTLIFALVVVPIQSIVALVIATVLHRLPRCKTLFRTIFFTPYVTSTVAVTVVFMRLFVRNGILSDFLQLLGFPNVTWFANVDLALPFLSIIYVWMNFGFYTVLFLTGLQTIPTEVYDAAAVDGAHGFQLFWNIIIPMLRPFLFLVLTTGIISAFQVFDQAYVLSRGGSLGSPAGATMTLVVFIYAQAFRYNRFGYGAAASVILLLIVSLVTVLLRTIFQDEIN
jgi:multiple sugar transport system permease protein